MVTTKGSLFVILVYAATTKLVSSEKIVYSNSNEIKRIRIFRNICQLFAYTKCGNLSHLVVREYARNVVFAHFVVQKYTRIIKPYYFVVPVYIRLPILQGTVLMP